MGRDDTMNAHPAWLPGSIAVSRLRVYDDTTEDGVRGGSPHVHLASAEAYVVLAGSGEVHTIDSDGLQCTELRPGRVVSFWPGTIHRLVNDGSLEILAIMQNAGLPEAGDAVMTFSSAVLADPAEYARVAAIPDGDEPSRAAAAAARRDEAVAGWSALAAAAEAGDTEPLLGFYRHAQRLVRHRVPGWRDLVEAGVRQQVGLTDTLLDAIEEVDENALAGRSLRMADAREEVVFGMCGRLTVWPGPV